jgi:hypothetical protein
MEARKFRASRKDETGQGDRTWHSQAWNVLGDKQKTRQDKAAGRNKDNSTGQDRATLAKAQQSVRAMLGKARQGSSALQGRLQGNFVLGDRARQSNAVDQCTARLLG